MRSGESWLACLKFEGTYTYFNPLTAMLDGLAGLIGKAAIPEKYYNPDAPDYNPLPAKIYAYASGKILTEINSKDEYRLSRQEFALICGAWNGLVGTIEAIPAGISMLAKLQGSAIDVLINHEGARDKLIKTLSNINEDQIAQLFSTIGDEIGKGYDKYTSNPCMKSYATGQAAFVIASMFIGAGEANVGKTFLQTLEKLDVAGQIIGRVFKIGGKFIKPIINAASKGLTLTLEKGVQLFRQVEIKLPNNLYCGIPIPNIKIRSTAAEIEQQLANAVEDTNGNKLVEVVLENGEKAPAIVRTEEGLSKIGKEGLENLSDYINRLFKKDIRTAILKATESKAVALKYFEKINKNPSEYLDGYTKNLNNFDDWYENVFQSELFEAHHIIPKQVLENSNLKKILDWARKNNKPWDFGGLDNGIMLQKRRRNVVGEIVGDHANHPVYNQQIGDKIDKIFIENSGDLESSFDDIVELTNSLKKKLNTEVIQGDKIVNNLEIN